MDLEIWLIGTPHEVATAVAALGNSGTVAGASKPEPLYGADSGRVRRYLRVRIPVTVTLKATGTRPPHKATGATQPVLTLPDAA